MKRRRSSLHHPPPGQTTNSAAGENGTKKGPPDGEISKKYYGPIQASDNARLHLGDNHFYGDRERLKYVPGAIYNAYGLEHRACHPGTRRQLLEKIDEWAEDPTSPIIFWLNGMAGTGKSTISYTAAGRMDQDRDKLPGHAKLGASYFFRRGEGDRASAALFFPTIVHQLRRKIAGLDSLIEQAIDCDPDICRKSLAEQFDKLLYRPLQALPTNQHPTCVIVVDALDECESEADIERLLLLWSSLSRKTSVRIRILLTSRPELPIRMGFADMPAHVYCNVVLHELPMPVIQQDIHTFLSGELAQIRERYNRCFPRSKPLGERWPEVDVLERLAAMAVPLFIMATTLCRFIHDKRKPSRYDPRKRLEIVLQSARSSPISKISEMYDSVLAQMLTSADDTTESGQIHEEGQLSEQFRLVVGTIVTVAEPLSMTSLAELLRVDVHAIEACLNLLHSVLWIPTEADAPVRPLHLSFSDYLCSDDLSDQRFRINPVAVHRDLFRQCLLLLSGSNGLRENICDLRFPGQSRCELAARTVEQHLSPAIGYACRYWVHHLQRSALVVSDQQIVYNFLRQHFLHWLEALSVLKCLGDALRYIETLQALMSGSSLITTFLQDARRFVLANRYICERAPLQLYSSAVVFAPQDSIIRNICAKVPKWIIRCPRTPRIWSAERQKLEGHVHVVTAVAFSPSGSQLASSSKDRTIRLWDAQSGQEVQRFDGHTHPVSAVVFSPDGSQLASASYDRTIRLWDALTGEEVQRFHGHTDPVNTVAFSPGGAKLASASWDRTVRLWDAKTGQGHEVQRLDGHSHSVSAVVFSPDGAQLASASWDRTVRLWDAQTGEEVQRLEGHTDEVNAVAFSPDGSQLASASWDRTVRLWNAKTGQEVQRLDGHTDFVSSVAFSPDGSQLASASWDRTVRLWDAKTGQGHEVQRLDGHTNLVNAVAFSPDGAQLASASRDRTVRLWDAQTRQEGPRLDGHSHSAHVGAFSPHGSQLASASRDLTVRVWDGQLGEQVQRLDGHTNSVSAVAFSPDGSQLASASWDQTVRLWDTQTGHQVQRLDGHTEWVSAVAFSPDGSQLASASCDQTVRLWDAQTGQEVQRLDGHTHLVNAVAFSPDGVQLASASDDLTVRLWDAQTGQQVRVLQGDQFIFTIRFTDDGQNLFTNRGTIYTGRPPLSSENRALKTGDNLVLRGDWIECGGRRVLWLPHEYRTTASAVHGDMLVIGCASGLVGFFQISPP